ncbi:MAG: 50S ribosome-binding GTPase [Phycisphaerae bacterium]|nr:50S ribosome-binding GTPase [Phycisphaerae bacterium]
MPPLTATLQTPPGRGGIAVIVLAGDGGAEVIADIFRPLRSHTLGGDDVLRLGRLVDGRETLDEAIVCCRGGVCEINIHGGPAVARRTLELLAARGAAVLPAAPAATESLPLVHPRRNNPASGTEMLHALAEARSDLVVAAVTQQWSAGLSELAGTALAATQARRRTRSLSAELRAAAAGLSVMQRLLRPAEVVLAGPVNVGKSTLANALVGRQVSIVHATAGTTRDWVRELAILRGVPIWLTDTAGLWEAPDFGQPSRAAGIDAEAVARARQRIEQAELILLVSAERVTAAPVWLHAKNILPIWAKSDLAPAPAGFAGLAVSAQRNEGLDALKQAILAALGLAEVDPHRPMAFTPRQAKLLTGAAGALDTGDTATAGRRLGELLTGSV